MVLTMRQSSPSNGRSKMAKYEVLLGERTSQIVVVDAASKEEAEIKGFDKQFDEDFSWDGKMKVTVEHVALIEKE